MALRTSRRSPIMLKRTSSGVHDAKLNSPNQFLTHASPADGRPLSTCVRSAATERSGTEPEISPRFCSSSRRRPGSSEISVRSALNSFSVVECLAPLFELDPGLRRDDKQKNMWHVVSKTWGNLMHSAHKCFVKIDDDAMVAIRQFRVSVCIDRRQKRILYG